MSDEGILQRQFDQRDMASDQLIEAAAEVERLRDENAELRCRLDELAAERDDWRTKASWI